MGYLFNAIVLITIVAAVFWGALIMVAPPKRAPGNNPGKKGPGNE